MKKQFLLSAFAALAAASAATAAEMFEMPVGERFAVAARELVVDIE